MGLIDVSAMGFAHVGRDIRIFDLTRIAAPERISLGSNVVVDDFVFLQGGNGLEIGSYVHIASFASVTGGGQGVIGAFASVSSGARVFTGTDLIDGSGLTGSGVPSELRAVQRARTELGQHVFLGANAVVLPGVEVGIGAVVGAGSVVTGDLEAWTINVGCPCRPIKQRASKTILEYARRLAEGNDRQSSGPDARPGSPSPHEPRE
jgi:acetyltransferase-like isoleucine patch superfamily enzyme